MDPLLADDSVCMEHLTQGAYTCLFKIGLSDIVSERGG